MRAFQPMRQLCPRRWPRTASPAAVAPAPVRKLCTGAPAAASATRPSQVARQEDGSVRVVWGDDHISSFHERWLFEHCPVRTSGTGGQKADAPAGRSTAVSGASAAAEDGGSIIVDWACGDHSTFDAAWLRAHCYSAAARGGRSRLRDPVPHALSADDAIPAVDYEDVMSSEEGVLAWTARLERHGLCVVRGVPCEEGEVARLAARVGPVMPSLYGDFWNVRVEPDAINIAYTAEGLEPHMDLAYYESPPGIQLLHCVEFADSVIGGESNFWDTFVLAELLRERDPEAFATLVRVCATFQKSHAEREHPAQMFYQRPHIVTDNGGADGAVTSVFWSPSFEGALDVAPEDVSRYYAAYDAFSALFADEELKSKHKVEFRLRDGDCITFNQRRLLHGRNAFDMTDGGTRHFQGCYLNIDDFLSRHRALATVGQVQGGSLPSADRLAEGGALWGVDWTTRISNGSHTC